MYEVMLKQKPRIRLNGFDYFVLTGAIVNLVVIVYLVGYWLFAA